MLLANFFDAFTALGEVGLSPRRTGGGYVERVGDNFRHRMLVAA